MLHERGFSLVELVVVLAIMGTLLAIATLNWQEMTVKSGIESQIKKMHADLMEVRMQSLTTKTARSVVITNFQMEIYSSQDTSIPPVRTLALPYRVIWSGGGTTSTITFDTQGLTNGTQTSLCIVPEDTTIVNSATADSIVVSQARINIGKRNGGDCVSGNVDQQ